jgi:hypothetical protein
VRVLALLVLLVMAANSAQAQRDRYPPLATVFQLLPPTLSIGSDQEGPTLFGTITDVTLDDSLSVYVLDRSAHVVRRFTRDGRFVAARGGAGRGPGDLAAPFSLVHDGKNTLYVIDRMNGVNVFDTRDRTLTYKTRFAAQYRPTDACLLGTELVVPAWNAGRILHLFSSDGHYKRSFGEGFSVDTSQIVRAMENLSPIAVTCDSEREKIYASWMVKGAVRGYDANGRLLWQVQLPDFVGTRHFLARDGPTTFWGEFTIRAMLPLGAELLLVQAEHAVPVGQGRVAFEHRGVMSYVLSTSTGAVVTRQYGSPLIGALVSDLALAYEDEPLPRAFLQRMTQGGR